MFTANTYQAEIEYRSNRIRNGIARKQRRSRVPFVRRPAETTAPR
jgi:hypothetical protein